MTIHVRVKIDPRAAVLARKAAIGVMPVPIEETDLAELSAERLAVLADMAEQSLAGAVLENPLISEPTLAALLAVVDERVSMRVKLLETEAKDAADRRTADIRAEEVEKARKHESKARDAANAKAISEWVEANGDDELRERHAAGFLDEQEIIDEVMHQLFEVNEDEHVRLRKEEACDCDKGCTNAVRFSIEPVLPGRTPLDSRQFETLRRVQESAPKDATVEPRMHKAACPDCKCTPMVRMAARVSLKWNGWLLVKEYSLG